MFKIKLRHATIRDSKGIANVLMQSYNINSIEEGEKAFKQELAKKFIYIVAKDKGKIIGLTTWQMHGLPKHGLAELDRIALLPEYRSKGIGKKLFDFLIKDVTRFYKKHKAKFRKIYLLTHASNKNAQNFYKKLGLKHEATLKSHYYDNEDEYIFSIFIKN